MFFKLKHGKPSQEKGIERGLLPTDSLMIGFNEIPKMPRMPILPNVRNIDLPELRNVQSLNSRVKSVEPRRKTEIELFENGKEARAQRIREASLKLKIKIAKQSPDSRTGTTQKPVRMRVANQRPTFNVIGNQHRSLDIREPRGATATFIDKTPENDIYTPKLIFKGKDTKNVLLIIRTEEYKEKVFDSLTDDIKNVLFNSVQKYIFSKKVENDRIQALARIMVNGMYVNKFIRKKENLYTPQKVMLPKDGVNIYLIKVRKKNTLFIEPMYTLALENPDFDIKDKKTQELQYLLRPGAQDFIAKVAQEWEVMIFTSRKQEDISPLVDMLDPLKIHIKFVMDRNNCDISSFKRCIKDLSTIKNLNRDTAIIIDYKPQNIAYSIDNGIIVMHWNGDNSDKELMPGLIQHLSFIGRQSEPAKCLRDRANYSQLILQIYKPGNKSLS